MGPTIIIHQMPDGIVHLMCSLCNARTTYLPNDKATFDLFRSEHLHEGLEAPLVVQKKVGKKLQDLVDKNAETAAQKDDWTDTMGTFNFNIGGNPGRVVAISTTALKLVAKLSNFNVDVQGNNFKYRGLCGNCQEVYSLTRESVLSLDKGICDENFENFLKHHRHDGITVDLPAVGRKFRGVGK
jgi:hypothetical protein